MLKILKMKKVIIVFTLLFAVKSIAQKNPEKELGVWYAFGGTHKISDKIDLKTQAQFRFFDIASDMQQLMLRFGGNYKINNTFSAYLGYAYFNTDATFGVKGGDANEQRIVEDFNINYKHSKLGISHRFRFEQRLFKNNTAHWFRYNIGLSHPISEKLSGYMYNEVFLNFKGDTYSQNWFGVGVKHKLSNSIKLQLGYHNISLKGGANFSRIITGIILSTNHTKK